MNSDWRNQLSKEVLDRELMELGLQTKVDRILNEEALWNVRQIASLSDEELIEIEDLGEAGFQSILCAIGSACIELDGIMPESLRRSIASHKTPKAKTYDFCIYLLEWNGVYKIGVSGNVASRIRGLSCLPGIVISLVHKVRVGNVAAYGIEKALHLKFQQYRVSDERFREWFNLPPDAIEWFCSLKDGDLDEFK